MTVEATWEELMASRARMRSMLADLTDPPCPGHGRKTAIILMSFDDSLRPRCAECGLLRGVPPED